MTFRMERGNDYELIKSLCDRAGNCIDCQSLVSESELPVFDKYDEYIPGELLRRAYSVDRLRGDEPALRLRQMLEEY